MTKGITRKVIRERLKKYEINIDDLDKNAIIEFKQEMKKLSDIRQKAKCKYSGNYLINGIEIVDSNSYLIDRFISVLSFDSEYLDIVVIDYLFDVISKIENDDDKLREIVDEVIKDFKIGEIISYRLNELNNRNLYYILLIGYLFKKNSFLVIDDLFAFFKRGEKRIIFDYAKKNNVTIINVSSRLDDVLDSKYLICLYNGCIAMEGEVLSCLREERLLKRLGFQLPFFVDLSIQLNYYDVIDGLFLTEQEMMDSIWN